MCVHVFGNKPSPAVATYGLRKSIETQEPSVQEFVHRNFYVDDGLASFSTPQEAIDVMNKTKNALKSGGNLRLHKIASNSQQVMDAFDNEDLASSLKDLDLRKDEAPLQHSLGLCWDVSTDTFTFEISQEDKAFTKRGVLSVINSIFDPLGFLAPVIIQGRILMRDIMSKTLEWDEPIPEPARSTWTEWKSSLKDLDELSVPRTIIQGSLSSCQNVSLHIFCDASEAAIAAVAYTRVVDISGNSDIGFVCGKAKVAPKHGHTIPRLELCAAVLAVELGDVMAEELDLDTSATRYYTDSKVVLGYIQNESRRFYTYVSNRVGRIHSSASPLQWNYVSTTENPADQGSRGLTPDSMTDSLWLTGPKFLLDKTSDGRGNQHETYALVTPDEDKEIQPIMVQVNKMVTREPEDVRSIDEGVQDGQLMLGNKHSPSESKLEGLGVVRFKKYSKWKKLVSAISLLKHWANGFKKNSATKYPHCRGWHECTEHKSAPSLQAATTLIIREAQSEAYGKEIDRLQHGKPLNRDSHVMTLSPYLDENGILRVGGRLHRAAVTLEEKHPILISGHQHVAKLIVQHCHEKVGHQGRHFTEGAIRAAGYWITGMKRIIANLLYNCVKCRRLRGPTCHQQMAELPEERVKPSPPFDMCGPWEVTTRRTRGGAAHSKR